MKKEPVKSPSSRKAQKANRDEVKKADAKLAVLPASNAQALFTADMMDEAVAVLRKNLGATKRQWSQAEREFIEVPDCSTQVEAAKCLLSYGIGQPIQRTITTQTTMDGGREIEERMQASPALRRAMRARLDAMESAGEKSAVIIDP